MPEFVNPYANNGESSSDIYLSDPYDADFSPELIDSTSAPTPIFGYQQQAVIPKPSSDWIGPSPSKQLAYIDGGDEYIKTKMENQAGKMGFIESITTWGQKHIPFYGDFHDMGKILKVTKAMKAIQQGQPVSDEDLVLVNTWMQEEQRMQNATIGGKVGEVLKGQVKFWSELGGIALASATIIGDEALLASSLAAKYKGKMGKEVAEEMAKRYVGRLARRGITGLQQRAMLGFAINKTRDATMKAAVVGGTKKFVGNILKGQAGNKAVDIFAKTNYAMMKGSIKGTLLAMANPGVAARSIAEQQLYNLIETGDEDTQRAIAMGFADSVIEHWSEVMGADIGKATGAMLTKIGAKPLADKIAQATAISILGKTGANGFDEAGKIMAKIGADGLYEEFMEERFGGFMRGLFGVQGDAGVINALDQMIPTTEQAKVELIAFAIPGMAGNASHFAGRKFTGATKYGAMMENMKYLRNQVTPQAGVFALPRDKVAGDLVGRLERLEKDRQENTNGWAVTRALSNFFFAPQTIADSLRQSDLMYLARIISVSQKDGDATPEQARERLINAVAIWKQLHFEGITTEADAAEVNSMGEKGLVKRTTGSSNAPWDYGFEITQKGKNTKDPAEKALLQKYGFINYVIREEDLEGVEGDLPVEDGDIGPVSNVISSVFKDLGNEARADVSKIMNRRWGASNVYDRIYDSPGVLSDTERRYETLRLIINGIVMDTKEGIFGPGNIVEWSNSPYEINAFEISEVRNDRALIFNDQINDGKTVSVPIDQLTHKTRTEQHFTRGIYFEGTPSQIERRTGHELAPGELEPYEDNGEFEDNIYRVSIGGMNTKDGRIYHSVLASHSASIEENIEGPMQVWNVIHGRKPKQLPIEAENLVKARKQKLGEEKARLEKKQALLEKQDKPLPPEEFSSLKRITRQFNRLKGSGVRLRNAMWEFFVADYMFNRLKVRPGETGASLPFSVEYQDAIKLPDPENIESLWTYVDGAMMRIVGRNTMAGIGNAVGFDVSKHEGARLSTPEPLDAEADAVEALQNQVDVLDKLLSDQLTGLEDTEAIREQVEQVRQQLQNAQEAVSEAAEAPKTTKTIESTPTPETQPESVTDVRALLIGKIPDIDTLSGEDLIDRIRSSHVKDELRQIAGSILINGNRAISNVSGNKRDLAEKIAEYVPEAEQTEEAEQVTAPVSTETTQPIVDEFDLQSVDAQSLADAMTAFNDAAQGVEMPAFEPTEEEENGEASDTSPHAVESISDKTMEEYDSGINVGYKDTYGEWSAKMSHINRFFDTVYGEIGAGARIIQRLAYERLYEKRDDQAGVPFEFPDGWSPLSTDEKKLFDAILPELNPIAREQVESAIRMRESFIKNPSTYISNRSPETAVFDPVVMDGPGKLRYGIWYEQKKNEAGKWVFTGKTKLYPMTRADFKFVNYGERDFGQTHLSLENKQKSLYRLASHEEDVIRFHLGNNYRIIDGFGHIRRKKLPDGTWVSNLRTESDMHIDGPDLTYDQIWDASELEFKHTLQNRKRNEGEQRTYWMYLGKVGEKEEIFGVPVELLTGESLNAVIREYKREYKRLEKLYPNMHMAMATPAEIEGWQATNNTFALNQAIHLWRWGNRLWGSLESFLVPNKKTGELDAATITDNLNKRGSQLATPGIRVSGDGTDMKYLVVDDESMVSRGGLIDGMGFYSSKKLGNILRKKYGSLVYGNRTHILKMFGVWLTDGSRENGPKKGDGLVSLKPNLIDIDEAREYERFKPIAALFDANPDLGFVIGSSSAKVSGIPGSPGQLKVSNIWNKKGGNLSADKQFIQFNEFDGSKHSMYLSQDFNYANMLRERFSLTQPDSIKMLLDPVYFNTLMRWENKLLNKRSGKMDYTSIYESREYRDVKKDDITIDGTLAFDLRYGLNPLEIFYGLERQAAVNAWVDHFNTKSRLALPRFINTVMAMGEEDAKRMLFDPHNGQGMTVDANVEVGFGDNRWFLQSTPIGKKDPEINDELKDHHPWLFQMTPEGKFIGDSILKDRIVTDKNGNKKILGPPVISIRVPSSGVPYITAGYLDKKIGSGDASLATSNQAVMFIKSEDADGDQMMGFTLVPTINKDGTWFYDTRESTNRGLMNRMVLLWHQAILNGSEAQNNAMWNEADPQFLTEGFNIRENGKLKKVKGSDKLKNVVKEFQSAPWNTLEGQRVAHEVNNVGKKSLGIHAKGSHGNRLANKYELTFDESREVWPGLVVSRTKDQLDAFKANQKMMHDHDFFWLNNFITMFVDDVKHHQAAALGYNEHTTPFLGVFAAGSIGRTIPQMFEYAEKITEYFNSDVMKRYVELKRQNVGDISTILGIMKADAQWRDEDISNLGYLNALQRDMFDLNTLVQLRSKLPVTTKDYNKQNPGRLILGSPENPKQVIMDNVFDEEGKIVPFLVSSLSRYAKLKPIFQFDPTNSSSFEDVLFRAIEKLKEYNRTVDAPQRRFLTEAKAAGYLRDIIFMNALSDNESYTEASVYNQLKELINNDIGNQKGRNNFLKWLEVKGKVSKAQKAKGVKARIQVPEKYRNTLTSKQLQEAHEAFDEFSPELQDAIMMYAVRKFGAKPSMSNGNFLRLIGESARRRLYKSILQENRRWIDGGISDAELEYMADYMFNLRKSDKSRLDASIDKALQYHAFAHLPPQIQEIHQRSTPDYFRGPATGIEVASSGTPDTLAESPRQRDERFAEEQVQREEDLNNYGIEFAASTGSYAQRTRENARAADLTVAIAVDFRTAGERATVKAAGDNYISFDYNEIANALEQGEDELVRVVSRFVSALNASNVSVLNIAGNGIYTFASHGITQQEVDKTIHDFLSLAIDYPTLEQKFSVRTGGQTGVDEAGAKAARDLGLNTQVLAPKNWTYRDEAGKDISNKVMFKARFATDQAGHAVEAAPESDSVAIKKQIARRQGMPEDDVTAGYAVENVADTFSADSDWYLGPEAALNNAFIGPRRELKFRIAKSIRDGIKLRQMLHKEESIKAYWLGMAADGSYPIAQNKQDITQYHVFDPDSVTPTSPVAVYTKESDAKADVKNRNANRKKLTDAEKKLGHEADMALSILRETPPHIYDKGNTKIPIGSKLVDMSIAEMKEYMDQAEYDVDISTEQMAVTFALGRYGHFNIDTHIENGTFDNINRTKLANFIDTIFADMDQDATVKIAVPEFYHKTVQEIAAEWNAANPNTPMGVYGLDDKPTPGSLLEVLDGMLDSSWNNLNDFVDPFMSRPSKRSKNRQGRYLDYRMFYSPHYFQELDEEQKLRNEIAGKFFYRKVKAKQQHPRVFETYFDALMIAGLVPLDNTASGQFTMYSDSVWRKAVRKAIFSKMAMVRDLNGQPMLLIESNTDATKLRYDDMGMLISDDIMSRSGKELADFLNSERIRNKEKPDYQYDFKTDPRTAMNKLIKKFNPEQHGYTKINFGDGSKFPDIDAFYVKKDTHATRMMEDLLKTEEDISKIYKKLLDINDVSKELGLGFSGFHYFALGESWLGLFGLTWQNPGFLFKLPSAWNGLTNTHRHLINSPEAFEEWMKAGLQVESTPPDFSKKAGTAMLEGFKDRVPVLKKGLEAIEFMREKNADWLWGFWLPSMKLYMANYIYNEVRHNNPDGYTYADVPDDILRQDIAQLMNNSFGGQDWDSIMWANPRVRNLMKLLVFAPDWTLSALNIAASPFGKTFTNVRGVSPIEVEWSRKKYWPAMAGIVMFALPNALQLSMYLLGVTTGTGDPDDKPFIWQNEAGKDAGPFGIPGMGAIDITPLMRLLPGFKGHPTGERRVYMRFAKQATEIFEGWLERPVKTALGKSSSIVKIAYEQIAQENTYGWDLDFKDEGISGFLVGKNQGVWGGRAMHVAKKFAPMSILSLLEGRPTTFVAPASRGMSKGMAIQKMAQILTAYADDRTWNVIKDNPKYLTNLHTLFPELMDAVERNGYDPITTFNSAKRTVLGELYNEYFNALNKGQTKKLEKIATSIVRVHGTIDGLQKSMKAKYAGVGKEYTRDMQQEALAPFFTL